MNLPFSILVGVGLAIAIGVALDDWAVGIAVGAGLGIALGVGGSCRWGRR